MADRSGTSSKAQESLGLPPGFRTYSPFPFAGMNVQSSPLAMADNEFLYLENFVRLGDGNLRTVWDKGSPIFTATGGLTVVWYAFFNIGAVYYCAVFLSDGSAVQVDMVTLSQTKIGGAGLFYQSSGLLPYARQWGTQYLVICNRNTPNDYWIWDGALLYGAGTVAPGGVDILSGGFNYSSTPTITAYGGHGSGLTLSTVEAAGSIAELNITNPGSGYQPGDQVQLEFTGGGSDSSPVLTATLIPVGVGGVNVTTPGSGYSFATVAFTGGGGSGAAGTATISDGVSGVTITNGGKNYTTASVAFSGGGGSGATGAANIVNGAIASITVTSPGANYTSAPTVIIAGDGSGASGTAQIFAGVISSIQVTAQGSGYTSAPTVVISGNGTGASGVAVLNPTGVGGINVNNPGSGFTSVPLITLVGGGGSGATGFIILTGTSVASIEVTAGGSGYTSPPTLNITGGGAGSGLTFAVGMNGDSVGFVVISSGGSGYNEAIQGFFSGGGGSGAGVNILLTPTTISAALVSSAGQFYTDAPAVQVTPGANKSAYATVTLMPFGVSGSALETFLSRIWIVNPAPSPTSILPPGGNWQVSAPGSLTDFATSDGAVDALNTDAFLQTQYTNVRQSSGYLYFFGDGSVSVVSNVNTSGSPVTTTYNYQNVDPQAGAQWRDSLQDFSRSTIIANATGVYGLYGGAATKISGKLDQLFTSAVFPPAAGAITPVSAVATIFNVKHYLLLMTILDPDTQVLRNIMVTWNEKDWVITSQSIALEFIATRKVGSSYATYGTDGLSVYPLFSAPSAALIKRLDTKHYGTDRMFIAKAAQSIWLQGQDNSESEAGIAGSLQAVISGLGVSNINGFSAQVPAGVSAPALNAIKFASPYPFWNVWGTSFPGDAFMALGLRITSQSPDFTLANLVIGYTEVLAFYG
jgi:hypothetical protein